MAVRLGFRDDKGKPVKIYLVNAYQPYDAGTPKSSKMVDEYYDRLRKYLAARRHDELLIMAADVNASIGTSQGPDDAVTGKFGNAHINDTGRRLRDFSEMHILFTPSTFFEKTEYNTRKHMRNNRGYQIDHFLVMQRDLKRVANAGVGRKDSKMLKSDDRTLFMHFSIAKSLSRKSNRR